MMICLSGYEEKLFKEAIQHISQAGITTDPDERNRLLKEAAKHIGHIKQQTKKRKEKDHGNPK